MKLNFFQPKKLEGFFLEKFLKKLQLTPILLVLPLILFLFGNVKMEAQCVSTGSFDWDNGAGSGYTWLESDLSRTYTNVDGDGLNVTINLTDANNQNCDAGNPSTFGDYTETTGGFGNSVLTYQMTSTNSNQYVEFKFTFSKPVLMDEFIIYDIDYNGDEPNGDYESFQDEVDFLANYNGSNVVVGLSQHPNATASVVNTSGQNAVANYINGVSGNVTHTDPNGAVVVSTSGVLTEFIIRYSNGPADADGVSDDHAISVPGFTFCTVNPDAIDDNVSTPTETPIDVDVLANDLDGNGDLDPSTVTVAGVTQPSNGTITNINSMTGVITYEPNLGFEGVDQFEYIVCDQTSQGALCDTAMVTINVFNSVAPIATDDYDFTDLNTDVNINVPGNDTDANGNLDLTSVSTTGVMQPSNGSLSIHPTTGVITYTPTTDFSGTDEFEYIICDTYNLCDTALVSVGINTSVLAIDDNASTIEGNSIDISVLDNDILESGEIDTTTMALGNNTPSNGTVTFNANGTVNYEPAANFSGLDTFEYRFCAKMTTGNVTGNFASTNIPINIPTSGTVTSTLTIPSGSGGTIVDINLVNLDITHPYISDLTISLTSPDNTSATMISGQCGDNDDMDITFDDEGAVLSACTDLVSGNSFQPLPFNASTQLSNFDSENSEGTWTLTVLDAFNPDGGSINGWGLEIVYVGPAGGDCDTAVVIVDVVGLPEANNDEALNQILGTVNLSILTNDELENGMAPTTGEITVDLDLGTAGIQTTLVVANEGTWTYTLASGNLEFIPSDSLSGNPTDIIYELTETATGLSDQASVNIEYINSTEATNDFTNTPFNTQVTSSVLTNDRDLEGNSQSITTLEVDTDGDGIPDATKSVGVATTVGGVNEGGTANTNAGTLTQNPIGSYIFTPAAGFVGTVTYEYTVCDDVNPQACEVAIVIIEVLPESNTSSTDVTASPDAYFTEEDITVTSTVFSNDNDPEGGTFDVTSAMIDTNGDGIPNANLTIGTAATIAGIDKNGNPVVNAGSLQINLNGTFTFIPTTGFTGSVTAEYDITDSDGDTDNAPLVIEIIPDVDNEIFATDDSALTDAETPVSGNLIANDVDPEGDSFTVTGLNIDTDGDGLMDSGQSGNIDGVTPITVAGTDGNGNSVMNAGSLIIDVDGSYTFTPSAGFTGNVNVCYTICDSSAASPAPPVACDPATLEISVLEVYRDYGDAPVAYPIAWHRAMVDNDSNNEFDGSNDVWLGSKSNFEGSQPSSQTADGDTFDDAITFGTAPGNFPISILPNSSYSVDLIVNSANANLVYYGMWIDWDEDGTYDSLYVGSQVTASPATAAITINSSAFYTGETVNIRIRVDDEPLIFADFAGGKTNGEVEDFQAFVALPVELSSFEARAIDCEVQLNWKTQSEEKFDYFEVEWSGDGYKFNSREIIRGNGGVLENDYTFIDKKAFEINYYRLKMVDLDGTTEYSKIVSIDIDCGFENKKFNIYPNPILPEQGTLNVEFYTEKTETQLLIVDILGKTVKGISFETESGQTNFIQIDISNLPAGTYSLQQVGTKTSSLFIVQE